MKCLVKKWLKIAVGVLLMAVVVVCIYKLGYLVGKFIYYSQH